MSGGRVAGPAVPEVLTEGGIGEKGGVYLVSGVGGVMCLK